MNFSNLFNNSKFKFMKKIIIGIDISSKTLDICLKMNSLTEHYCIENQVKIIRSFFKKFACEYLIVAMENTGRYNWNLYEALESFSFKVYVLPPLHLKKSLGLIRGKNDKIDALTICQFIEKNQDECIQWKPTPMAIKKMKVLITERSSRMKIKMTLLKQRHDYKLMKKIGLDKELMKLNKSLIECIEKQIHLIESKIEILIQEDIELKKQSQLIRSIPGVGKVLSWLILSKTEGFTFITEPRKLACYAGVVPFDFQSGTSLNRKPRLSVFADKSLKSALHLGAMSAIRLNNDLRVYYLRKVKEGKNKMSVLNAVRNKIIHRIFAVTKNQVMYKKDLVLS